ncbi:hypothetical protein HPB50_015652 [Hyalomma asiaticum]|uniref:Uncharacterized protein n=1 Tax=Hyalomma asiaticum TaxID=266040 RepID=A0ACB7TL43_HYAAI|nr:hypothetical protein HPB50_015652 [Hyalomma asiaticum]
MSSNGPSEVIGKCAAQMKSIDYDVRLELYAHPRHIVSASCTCKAGCRGWCKHAVAVAVYLNKCEHTSRTDLPCAWLGPSSRPILDAKKKIKDLFPGRPLPAPQLKPSCATAVLAKFPDLQCPLRQVLEDPGNSLAMRADAAENVARHIDRGLMREVIDHERNVYHVMEVVHTLPLRIGMRNMLTAVTSPERAFYEAVVQKTIDQIMDIEHETRGQSKVPRLDSSYILNSPGFAEVLTGLSWPVAQPVP